MAIIGLGPSLTLDSILEVHARYIFNVFVVVFFSTWLLFFDQYKKMAFALVICAVLCAITIGITTPTYNPLGTQQQQQEQYDRMSIHNAANNERPPMYYQQLQMMQSESVNQLTSVHHDIYSGMDMNSNNAEVVAVDKERSGKSLWEAYLLKVSECQTIQTWCCGQLTTILCTCGSAKTCSMSFKNIRSYQYTVYNGNFTDVSGRYWLVPVTLCNTGDVGSIFVTTY